MFSGGERLAKGHLLGGDGTRFMVGGGVVLAVSLVLFTCV